MDGKVKTKTKDDVRRRRDKDVAKRGAVSEALAGWAGVAWRGGLRLTAGAEAGRAVTRVTPGATVVGGAIFEWRRHDRGSCCCCLGKNATRVRSKAFYRCAVLSHHVRYPHLACFFSLPPLDESTRSSAGSVTFLRAITLQFHNDHLPFAVLHTPVREGRTKRSRPSPLSSFLPVPFFFFAPSPILLHCGSATYLVASPRHK
jgi:hypothetical protein